MATPFDRLMETIRPHLPGALDIAIKQELFMACDDFLNTSDTWRETIDFQSVAGSREAEVMPFAGRILRLISVEQDNVPVRGVVMTDTMQGTILLPFEASTVGDYKATLSLTVTDPTSRDAYPIIPYEIVQKYTSVLISGILSRMMAQPAKPYTNLTLAQFHLLKFKGGAARAKNELKTGNTQGSQAWTFPQSFNRRK